MRFRFLVWTCLPRIIKKPLKAIIRSRLAEFLAALFLALLPRTRAICLFQMMHARLAWRRNTSSGTDDGARTVKVGFR